MVNNDVKEYEVLSLISIILVFFSAIYGFIELGGEFSLCGLIACLNAIIYSISLCYFEKYKQNIDEYGLNIFMLRIIFYFFVGFIVIGTSAYGWIFSLLCFVNVVVNAKKYRQNIKEQHTEYRNSNIVRFDLNTDFSDDEGDQYTYSPEDIVK